MILISPSQQSAVNSCTEILQNFPEVKFSIAVQLIKATLKQLCKISMSTFGRPNLVTAIPTMLMIITGENDSLQTQRRFDYSTGQTTVSRLHWYDKSRAEKIKSHFWPWSVKYTPGVCSKKMKAIWVAAYLSHADVKVERWHIDVFIDNGMHWWQIDCSLLFNCVLPILLC